MTEDKTFVYRLEKVITEGDTPSMLMLSLKEEHEINDVITLQNSDVKWKIITKEDVPSSENKPRFNE